MKSFQYIVVGAGPAGLQMGYFLKQRNDSYLILEQAAQAGAFFKTHPRHRKLLSINKRFTGYPDLESRLRYDWNSLINDDEECLFTRYSKAYFPDADELVRYLEDFAKRHALAVQYGAAVQRISRSEGRFLIALKDGETYTCERLLIATGLSQPNIPDVPGVELCEHYATFPVDPAGFEDQKVMIVGKGNSAFETAESLTEVTQKIQICGPRHVKLAWASHYVGDLRAVNNNFLDTYHLKGQNNILDGELKRVTQAANGKKRAEVYFDSRKRSFGYECDRIILCTGFRFDDSIFDETCRPRLTHKRNLPELTSEWESSNVQGMYFIGTLMQVRDFKKTMSGFIHGFRNNIEALDQIFDRKYRGRGWRRVKRLARDPQAIAGALIERCSTGAGTFLQPGFLCDLLVIPEQGEEVEYYEEMPVDYVHEHERAGASAAGKRFYLLTLEYAHGDGSGDPFARPRGVGVVEDHYLHPVIRLYQGGAAEAAGRFFLPDDLDNDWRLDPANLQAVRSYFAAQLSGPGNPQQQAGWAAAASAAAASPTLAQP